MDSGFKFNNLLMLETSFKREPVVTFDESKVTRNTSVNVNVSVTDKLIHVIETLTLSTIHNETKREEVSATIKIVGVFEKFGESQLTNLNEFGHINGAAIIFPYIREHLSNLTSRAGLGQLLLAPVNFEKLYRDSQSK